MGRLGRKESALALAVSLAAGAVAAAVVAVPALSLFLAMIAVPVALYAVLATRRVGIPVAFSAAFAGVAVIVYWVYTWIEDVRGA